MSRAKTMTIIFTFVALVIIIIAMAVWWYVFFGTMNPPLPQATVTVATQSSMPGVSPGVTTTASSVVTTVPIVDGENPPLAGESLSIDGASFTVEIASTMLEQTRGLSFRPSLGAQFGMLFIFGSGNVQTFWMKDMNFPLDMIWISGNTVVGFAQNVPAPAPNASLFSLPTYTSPADVDKVLEVNAGTVAKYNIKVGDTVTIVPTA